MTNAKMGDIFKDGINPSGICAHATAGMQSADNKMVSFFIFVSYFMNY